MSTSAGKDTIYIDIDDEITAIIDKVRGSHEKIVALVLPKRATVLQSIVNMKLLKRTADEAKKHLVLITGEAGLLPLAGSVGIYVAKTLQSRPEIPDAHPGGHDSGEDLEESVTMADDSDASLPVGEHVRQAPASVKPSLLDEDQPIELDNTVAPSAFAAASGKKPKKGSGKKFNIPDFDKFRLWAILGGVATIVLVFLWYMGFVIMPRASVSIKTNSTAIQENLDLTLNPIAKEVDADDAVIPSVIQTAQKTLSQQVEVTGQKDKGTKASGSVSMSAGSCTATAPNEVPAGTGLSASGLTYITQTDTMFTPQIQKGKCTWVATSSTQVVAQNNGDKYNIAATSFTIAGRSDVMASSATAMSGGTSQIVKVVSQADIDSAKQKIGAQDTDAIKQELQRGLTGKGLYAIDGSFKAGDPEASQSANAGDEVASVSVTQKITYTMMGAKQVDLKKVIAAAVEKKIDKSKQQIINYGLDTATFKFQNEARGSTLVTMDVTAVTGSDLDVSAIKSQIAGKKSSDAKEVIGKYPGVTEVIVDYDPFWVSAIPKKTNKITVTVEKPVLKKDAANEQ